MNVYIVVAKPQLRACLILVAATIALFVPAADAQTYLFGGADFFAGPTSTSVVVADFNGDGRPDMAVSDSSNNEVSILLGSANGSFVNKGVFATGTNPSGLVAADFNKDKNVDLAVVNANSGTISILLGNGDGTFQSRVDYPVGQNPQGIVAADLNGNGKIDLATSSLNDSAITILSGVGNGGFEVQALVPLPSPPSALTSGDVNGDGKTDLIAAGSDSSGGAITVLLNQGDGSFTQVTSPAPYNPSGVFGGDFDSDGKLDALTVSGYSIYLSLGNGDGSFQAPIQIPNTPSVYAPASLVGDFNHDHKLDVAINGAWVLLGKGDGTFEDPILSPTTANPIAVADMNGDGEPDLLAIDNSGAIAVLLGNGTGQFTNIRDIALASTPYFSGGGVAADFNGDGKLDLAVPQGNYPNGQVSTQLGNGDGTFGKPIVSALAGTATNPYFTVAADFNGDGKTDLATLDDSGLGFQVLLGRGNGRFGKPLDTALTNSVYSFAAADLNKDGKADLILTTTNNVVGSLNIYLSRGNGKFTLGQQYLIYPNSQFAVADVNDDGKPDLITVATQSFQSANILVFLGNGDGTFQNPIFGPSDTYSSQPAIGDFNHDGKMDIAVGTTNGIAFLPGKGDGTFGTQVYSNPQFQFSGSLIASDFSGDQKLDLAGHTNFYYTGTSIVAGHGNGTFGTPVTFDAISNGQSFNTAYGDFNSDGVSDLGLPGQLSPSNSPVIFLYLSAPTPNLLPATLSFPAQSVGTTSPAKKVRFANIGNSALKISSIAASGDFLQQNTCGQGLAVGKSCVIRISFKPQAKGVRVGQVVIVDNAPGQRQRIALKGTGK